MSQPITVVDAFTDTAFGGNPAAVCVLSQAADPDWMQAVAAEMNLSETAFVAPHPDGEDGVDYDLRWFTPTVEVPLCGHATLATTHALGRDQQLRFHTRSGVLRARRQPDGRIELDFPAIHLRPADDPSGWPAALGLAPDRVLGAWAGDPAAAEVWNLVQLADPDDVRAAVPDSAAIVGLGGQVIVVATPGDTDGVDSVCRVFAPGFGIDEDPVTGAAHCVIAPWLADRTGRHTFLGRQDSARGGVVGMQLVDDRVLLTGQAVTVLEGALLHSAP